MIRLLWSLSSLSIIWDSVIVWDVWVPLTSTFGCQARWPSMMRQKQRGNIAASVTKAKIQITTERYCHIPCTSLLLVGITKMREGSKGEHAPLLLRFTNSQYKRQPNDVLTALSCLLDSQTEVNRIFTRNLACLQASSDKGKTESIFAIDVLFLIRLSSPFSVIYRMFT